DLHARDDAGGHAPGDGGYVFQNAVDAHAYAHLVAVGGEVHVRGAALDRLRDDLVYELDDRGVVGGLAQGDDLRARLPDLLGGAFPSDHVLEAVHTRDEVPDRFGGGDRDLDFVAGHDRDVVDREHVGGVGHREQHRALVHERDRDRLVALGGGADDQVG